MIAPNWDWKVIKTESKINRTLKMVKIQGPVTHSKTKHIFLHFLKLSFALTAKKISINICNRVWKTLKPEKLSSQ